MDEAAIVCGVEEPIQPNEMLYAANERDDGLSFELARFTDPRLNRYSFVLLEFDPPRAAEVFASLLRAILKSLGTTAAWVLARPFFPMWTDDTEMIARLHAGAKHWPKHAQGPRTLMAQRIIRHDLRDTDEWRGLRGRWSTASDASKSWIRDKQHQGWTTVHDDALAIAVKLVDDFDSSRFGPPGSSPANGNLLMFIGNPPPADIFLAPPLRHTLESFGRVAPSPEFLAWLAETGNAVAYIATDQLNRAGLVIVGALYLDIAYLLNVGIVQEIDADPPHVWQRG